MPTVLNDYYRARYYHPTFQRFVGEDPLSFAGGDANLYAYVANNPTNARDPSGLMALSATLGVTLGGSILVKTAFGAGVGVIADAMGQLLATGTVDPIGLVIGGAAGALGGRAAFQAAAAGLAAARAAALGALIGGAADIGGRLAFPTGKAEGGVTDSPPLSGRK